MIESVVLLLRLAAGLGSIEVAGYALLLLVLPRQSRFTPLERLTFAFGLGSFGITMWMLLLSFWYRCRILWGQSRFPGWPWRHWQGGRPGSAAGLRRTARWLLAGGYALLTLGEQVEFFPARERLAAALRAGVRIQFPAGDPVPDLGLGRPVHLGIKSQGLLSGPRAGFEPD